MVLLSYSVLRAGPSLLLALERENTCKLNTSGTPTIKGGPSLKYTPLSGLDPFRSSLLKHHTSMLRDRTRLKHKSN